MGNIFEVDEFHARADAVDFGVGSIRLEGFCLSAEEHAENEHYVNGDITIDDMLASARGRYQK